MFLLQPEEVPSVQFFVTSYSWAWAGPHQLETWFWTGLATRSRSPRLFIGIKCFLGLWDPTLSLLLLATRERRVRPLLLSKRRKNAAPIWSRSVPAANCKSYAKNSKSPLYEYSL